MGYLGSVPVLQSTTFTGVNSQSFSPNGSTASFTMNRTVANTKDIEVIVDNVQQSPYDGSYSVSGNQLVFSENPPAGTNSIYVIFRDAPIGSITDPLAVKKAGDTMTGALTMEADAGGTVLFTKGRVSDGLAQLGMRNNTNTAWTGLLQFPADGSMIWNGGSALQERFKVDASGRVTSPLQPAFLARITFDGTITNGADINFDGIELNRGSCFGSSGNRRFTAPVSGVYQFTFGWHEEEYYGDWGNYRAIIRKNGSDYMSYRDTPGAGGSSETVGNMTILMPLAANDYVTCAISPTNGSNPGLENWDNYFCGYLIG